MAAANCQNQKIVVLAERDAQEMKQEIQQHFFDRWKGKDFFNRRWKLIRMLETREGCCHDADDLMRAGAQNAMKIIVLGRDGAPRDADLDVIRIVVALASLPEPVNGRILAEVQCADVGKVLRRLHRNTEVVHARSAVNHVLGLMCAHPILGECLMSLCSFAEGEEIYAIEVEEVVGKTFKEIRSGYFERILCIGVQELAPREESFHCYINMAPDDSKKIARGERLLVLAKSVQDVSFDINIHRGADQVLWQTVMSISSACDLPTVQRKPRLLAGGEAIFKRTLGKLQASLSPRFQTQDQLQPQDQAQDVQDPSVTVPELPDIKPVVVIGWPADAADILNMLDQVSPKGTVIHLLSEKSVEARETVLTQASVLFTNLTLVHYVGARTSEKKLRQLPLLEAVSILIISQVIQHDLLHKDDHDVGDDTITSDSMNLASLLVIADILQLDPSGSNGMSRGSTRPLPFSLSNPASLLQALSQVSGFAASNQDQLRAARHQSSHAEKIVCEVLDARTDRLLLRNQSLNSLAMFFRSKALETGLFTMATMEPAVFNSLLVLMSPSCPSFQVRDISRYWPPPTLNSASSDTVGTTKGGSRWDASFMELCDKVRADDNALLVGYCRSASGLDFVPQENRLKKLEWSKTDFLIVIEHPPLF
eukprot:TRINITY_DN21734_c0_g2_i1.p1 TRINITY_DN21734_c0_g2~~TRINITY_DN21734_c0_g2_i1.p1  ORF type:complete len:681 (+),score=101.49 TRINITY_DN21734_c0_g2_i1:88-2043(+)